MNDPWSTPKVAERGDESPLSMPWMQTPCRTHDPDLFFPGKRDTPAIRYAQSLCAGCPLKQACADYAEEHKISHGVWGGVFRDRKRVPRGYDLAPHGTAAARRRHNRRGEKACEVCNAARRRERQDAYALKTVGG